MNTFKGEIAMSKVEELELVADMVGLEADYVVEEADFFNLSMKLSIGFIYQRKIHLNHIVKKN